MGPRPSWPERMSLRPRRKLGLEWPAFAPARGPMRVEETLTSGAGSAAEMQPSVGPDRFANLDQKWFWEDSFEIPRRSCWAADHAAEVARLRREGWTIARLATHFERTPPTIRHALKISAELDQGRSDQLSPQI
jgi:hypothetical protein